MAFDKRKSLQSALTYSQQGKWDKAIAEYQAILKADPHDLTVCNNLGDLYARVGKGGEAIEQYLKLGELYRADGLSVKAIAVYKKIIKLDANRTQALLACADLYEEQGLTGEAKIQLTFVAEQFHKAGDTAKVLEIYQRLAVLDQTNHTLLTKLADLLVKAGKREEAAAQYELAAQAAESAGHAAETKRLRAKARDLTPASARGNLAQAQQFLHDGKYSEAVEALLKVTASDNANAQAWHLLGEAYVGLGQGSEAITALEQAVNLGLAEKEVRRPLAKALVLEGRTDEGVSLCQQLAADALARNTPDEAVTNCQEIAALAPNSAPIQAYLVQLLQELGRSEEARGATWALAQAHEASDQTESAIQVYHQLLQRDPSDAEAKARLEALEGLPVTPAQSPELAVPGPETAPDVEEARLQESEPVEAAFADPSVSAVAAAAFAAEEPTETEVASAQPPALELSNETLTLGDLNALGLGEGTEPESQPTQVFELDDTGELAGVRPHATATAGPAELEGSSIEFPGISPVEEVAGARDLEEEEGASGEVAELLAEAEVYLKYGLIEKARERLLEVIGLAPENLTAHRRLKTLYVDRPQAEEACAEVLTIARILQSRGRLDAAQRELQEGLRLAPANTALQEMLAALSGTSGVQEVAHSESGLDVPETLEVQSEVVQMAPGEHALPHGTGLADASPSEGTASDGAPPIELPALGGETTPSEEELPPEFRSFLEEPAEGTNQVLEASPGDVDQAMTDDLAEANFYLSQGMIEEVRAVHRRMRARDATHPAVAQLEGQIDLTPADAAAEAVASAQPESSVTEEAVSFAGLLEDAEPTPEASPIEDLAAEPAPPQIPAAQTGGQPKFSVIQGGGEAGADGYINLGAELQEELAAEEQEVSSEPGAPPVEDLLRQFQQGVREHLDEKDFETHYNLGIAYKEMELYDEAIQEFRLTARDPGRTLACADLLGLCYLAKNDPTEAIREFRIGLEVRGHPPESYYDIRYDLAVAHETSGDWERALELFEALQADDEQFRDVSARVKQLRERLPGPQVTSAPSSPIPPAEPSKGARAKRISFI